MSFTNSCRLCLTINNGNHLDIFSVNGMEMKMCEIIAEHFKCEVNVLDSLPNFICQVCWHLTEAFHELYQKSKVTLENLLNRSIKIEPEVNESWPSYHAVQYIEDSQPEIGLIKVETILKTEQNSNNSKTIEESDSNGVDPIDFDENTDESDDDSNNAENVESDVEESAKEKAVIPTETIDKPKRKRTKAKQLKANFEKQFAENKQLFDMSCDLCPTIFETLYEAQEHYAKEHKNPRGYIKCCNQRLIYPCFVLKHLERHINPNKYRCSQCEKVFLCNIQLTKHMKKHTEKIVPKEKNLPCNICMQLFLTQSGLDHHMRRHQERDESEDGPVMKFIAENFDMKCDHCDTIFSGFHDARRHYKELHNDEKGYIKCCNIKLRELCRVREHVLSHLDPDCLKCDICAKSFPTGLRLARHKRRHKMKKRFLCDCCGKSYGDKLAITRHLLSIHVNSKPKYECDICQKKFRLDSLLRNHKYAVHREKNRFSTCEVCGKSFYTKFHLDKHMLCHMDKSERLSERIQCQYCGEWLMTRSGVFYHHQKHTSGIQKCGQCEMELPNRVSLLGHIRQYHREHKFKCSYCDKKFPTRGTMKAHEECHTRHKTYECEFCPKTFNNKHSIKTHTRRNHGEEVLLKLWLLIFGMKLVGSKFLEKTSPA
ncbi:transcription factor grauzone-like [Contarinia nasturtii]|uniref:transcription factor grauzone-like n=1 Tax=Contarinia nasturtii TaxID=265458 RepID=UPI0012D3CC0A|nr:transcription factor grauzone-like [Contarinia nasturtii]